ncbi:TPA: hypothetical protein N8W83_002496 [Legionella pneumophila]|nr:hypothetical protein [Legionella pneumophila]HCO4739646.1 hypothetical protein [Legionella pneumophila]
MQENDELLKNQLDIQKKLSALIGYEISNQHVATIIASWRYYEVLILLSNSIDLKRIKRDVRKIINLQNKVLDAIRDKQLHTFDHRNTSLPLFSSVEYWIRFEKILHKKKGSYFNHETLTKYAFFELLFLAESLGIKPPEQNYETSKFKKFLQIIVGPFNFKERSLEYYCQEYHKTKSKPHLKAKFDQLLEEIQKYSHDVKIWTKFVEFYQDKLFSLL